MQLTVNVLGEDIISRDLSRISDNMGDLRPAFLQMFTLLEESEKRQFDSQGSYGSGGWAPLSPVTLQRKAALGLPSDILVATGAMRDSLIDGGSAGAVRHMTQTRAVFGTADPKAIFHQMGTERMPRRRPVQPPEQDRRNLVKVFQRQFFTGVAA